jgi:hypothetical protein
MGEEKGEEHVNSVEESEDEDEGEHGYAYDSDGSYTYEDMGGVSREASQETAGSEGDAVHGGKGFKPLGGEWLLVTMEVSHGITPTLPGPLETPSECQPLLLSIRSVSLCYGREGG